MLRHRFFLYFLCASVSLLAFTCAREYPATAPYTPSPNPTPDNPGSLPPQNQPPTDKRLYIANDKVRLGIGLNAGGAITYLAEAGTSENMINNPDLGRQLQSAFYSGPIPYSVNGKQPVYQWRNLGWNPVQTGDYFNNPARIVSYQQDQYRLYVKSIPSIWPLFDEPADCTMEHWMELQDNTIKVRCRLTVNRRDTTQYEARTQETPCVYLNGPWHRMVVYDGTQPFTNAAVSEYSDQDMLTRYGTENWVALLNDKGRGLGLYRSNEFRFQTAGFGVPKVGGEFDQSSGYMNNNSMLQIDHNGVYEYEYTLVLGSLADIRQYAYAQPRPATKPDYRFTQNRAGWYYYNTRDRGWPIQNELNVNWQRNDSTKTNFRITSPIVFWRAADVPRIYVQAAFQTKATVARMVWRRPGDIDFYDTPDRYVEFPIVGDGQFRTYEIPLAGHSGWTGAINQICLVNPPSQTQFEKGSTVRIRSITASPVQ